MSEKIKFFIDGKECLADAGDNLIDAAEKNGVFIPFLCHMKGVIPSGSCRVCNIKVNGRNMTACTTPVAEGMEVENDTAELNDMRKAIVEVLFVSGNHFCPSCEKSGDCELQALGYRYQMMVPRFPYLFPNKEVDPTPTKLYIERNRCILCKRCVRTIKDNNGKSIFAYNNRGNKLRIKIDLDLANKMTDAEAQQAMDTCPVGCIIRKGKGYDVPIGKRKYDKNPIGSDIENKA